MKIKFFVIGMTLLMIPVMGISQRPGGGALKQDARERIEAQRVAYITQQMKLTPDEAAKFWPVYNEHKEALKNLRDDIERPDLMSVTDDEASVIIERHLQMEQKRLELNRALYTRLRTVVTPRKILMLHAAERNFNRELLKRANEFRKE